MVQAYSPHEARWYKFTTNQYSQNAFIKNIWNNSNVGGESVAIPLDITNRYIRILDSHNWDNAEQKNRFDILVYPTKEALLNSLP